MYAMLGKGMDYVALCLYIFHLKFKSPVKATSYFVFSRFLECLLTLFYLVTFVCASVAGWCENGAPVHFEKIRDVYSDLHFVH